MATPKPTPPAGKEPAKKSEKDPKKNFVRRPFTSNRGFRDSEALRNLQTDLRRNNKR